MSRLSLATKVSVLEIARPFSAFEFAERQFQGSAPIRRLFSMARSQGANSLILEDVPHNGAVASEVEEIRALFPDYKLGDLKRISFWKTKLTEERQIAWLRDYHCLGYALLKRDVVKSLNVDRWHVFESVFVRYPHHHNYCPAVTDFQFRAGKRIFAVRGSLYSQQNQLNKACAQVALRSVCATYLRNPDLTYKEINDLARQGDPSFEARKGLWTHQIPQVLAGLGIPYFDLDYETTPDLRDLVN